MPATSVRQMHEADSFFFAGTKTNRIIYWLLLLFLLAAFVACFFIRLDVSVTAAGIIRPVEERTDIKPAVSGIIDSVYIKEGAYVSKGDVLITLRDNNTASKSILNNYELNLRRQYIHDLRLLTDMGYVTPGSINLLQSPMYRQQMGRFVFQKAEREADIKKTEKELSMNQQLEQEKVVAPKELFDVQVANEKLQASYNAFKQEQKSIWQQDLSRYQLELSQLQAQQQQLYQEKRFYTITAQVSGVVQGVNKIYAGNVIQPGESLATISPASAIIAECNVSTTDIGMIKNGQPVKLFIDAFNYNYFGLLTGKVIQIDDDYTMVENVPYFKVRCLLDSTQVHLKNGFSGKLKKGMTVSARCVIAERTIAQLMFDKVDDWLNPSRK